MTDLRAALEKLASDWSERATGYDEYRELRALLAAHPAESAPRPVIDRQAALKAIEDASNPEGSDNIMGRKYVENWADVFADAVMGLARPMPTREQIAEAVHATDLNHHWGSSICTEPCRSKYLRRASAVLALINGSES